MRKRASSTITTVQFTDSSMPSTSISLPYPLSIQDSPDGIPKTNSAKHIVGNKAKGRISKRLFQKKNKPRQIFRKTNISYPLIRTRTCAYQGVRNVRFSENLAYFVFLKHPFLGSPFCLITDDIIKVMRDHLTQSLISYEIYIQFRLWNRRLPSVTFYSLIYLTFS